MSGYPITEIHKKLALENIKRLAVGCDVELYEARDYGWQVLVSNDDMNTVQNFDAYLVGENYIKRPEFADMTMLAELRQHRLVEEEGACR